MCVWTQKTFKRKGKEEMGTVEEEGTRLYSIKIASNKHSNEKKLIENACRPYTFV